MPTYRYMCEVCDEVITIRSSFEDADKEVECPVCLEERLISPANVIFKGSDFYVTESRNSRQKPEWDG